MKIYLYITLTFCYTFLNAEKISRFDINVETDMNFVSKLLNEAAENESIIATPKAGKTSFPPILLKNKTIAELIPILCKMSGLAYSYDKDTETYTFKTLTEYRDELVAALESIKGESVRHYRVDPLNLEQIAVGLEPLFGDRLYVDYGLEIQEEFISGGGNSSFGNDSSNFNNSFSNNNQNNNNLNNNNRNNNRNNNDFNNSSSRGSDSNKDRKSLADIDLTPEMVVKIQEIRNSSDPESLQKTLEEYIYRLTKEASEIIVLLNQEHSIVTVRTNDMGAFKIIEDYIQQLNQDVPQILLEMKILELTIGDDFSSVFDYSIQDPFGNSATNLTNTGDDFLQLNPGSTFGPDSSSIARGFGTFAYEMISQRVAARIELLKQDNMVETLATPILIATNNRVGEIKIVTNEVFIEGFTYEEAETDDNGNITNPATLVTDISQEDVGLTLRIKPQINQDDSVSLTIYQEDSSKISDGAKIPVAIAGVLQDQFIDIKSEKTISSTVIARDNTMIAIGGLVRTENSTTESKVPVLGDIPALGYFFKDEVTNNVKKELVLLITPHIMRSGADGYNKSKTLLDKTSDHNFHDKGQKGLDEKNSNIKEYKKPTKNPIRDFIKDPFDQ